MPKSRQRATARPTGLEWVHTSCRWVVTVAFAGSILGVMPSLHDRFGVVKFVVLSVGTLVLVALGLWAALRRGVLRVPLLPSGIAFAAVVAVLALTSLAGDAPLRSFIGEYGRYGGVLTLAAVLVVFLTIAISFTRADVERLGQAAAIVTGVVVGYGLLQVVGVDPLFDDLEQGRVVATLGQVNFLAAYIAIGVPFLVWAAVSRRTPPVLRALSGAVAVAALVVAVETRSAQAYPSLLVGLVVLLIVALPALRIPQRTLVVVGALIVVVAAVGVIGLRERIGDEISAGLEERELLWEAAAEMVADRPLFGFGASGYADRFSEYRPTDHVRLAGPNQLADAPHNIPLGIAVSGGAVALGAYVAFVALVGRALLQARRHEGTDLLLLGAFAGGWAAFQVQSLVSIDVVPLAAVHAVTAGGLVALAPRDLITRRLPWAPRNGGRARVVPGYVYAGALLGAIPLVLAALLVLRPLRADAAYTAGADARADGRLANAVAEFNRATDLAPWNGLYWSQLAATLVEGNEHQAAFEAGQRAVVEAPSAIPHRLSLAQLAAALGREQEAEELFRSAVELAPYLAAPYVAYGEFELNRGNLNEAVPLLRDAVERDPAVVHLELLATAYELRGDDEDAALIRERIVEIQAG